MAIINGTNFNDNDTLQFNFPLFQFFSRLDGTSGDDSIFGFAGNDILNGFNGNDLLDGGTGVDAMNGGDGSDTYIVDNAGDTTTENFDDSLGGVDTVNSSVSRTLGFGFENLNLTGSAAINGTGNAKNNIINGNTGANIIDGGAGADVLHGGDGSDTYFVDNVGDTTSESFNDALGGVDTVNASASHTIGFGIENLNLTGTAANGTGNSNNNIINGNSSANVLDGGTGADTMNAGDGSDTYFVDNVGDVVSETFNDALGGVDTVNSSVSFGPLGNGIENLNLTGFAAINGTGNSNNNIINGNSAANVLIGGAGVDTLNGNGGNDTITSDGDGGTYNGGDGDDLMFSGLGNETMDGGNGVDTINHTAFGGAYVFNMATGLTNFVGESYVNFENVIMGSGNDTVTGNSSANVINGGAGADTMNAGDGSDTYFVDNVGDVVSETFNDAIGGVDTVNSSVSFGPLGFGIENLNLTGSAANGTGNSNNNIINGNSASNILDGGTGADTMNAGDGSDTYVVDNVGDVVSETFNDALGGVDTVNSSVSHTLGFGIENLNLTGSGSNINGTGNGNNNIINGTTGANTMIGGDGNDTLFGDNGNDILDGGTGADSMNGDDQNDTYFVDNVGDTAFESFNDAIGGVDTVNSSVSHTLGFGIEKLNLTGGANINGAGNANNNVINGNTGINTLDGADGNDTLSGGASNDVLNGGNGNDVLNGGLGADTMTGGLGNDTYFVNTATDVVVEAAGVGTGVDLVNSSISYLLGLNFENLTLSGAANINGIGNAVNNVMRGNGGANTLNGNAGNDNLIGNAGNDTLNGGAGNDTINGGDGNDLIIGGAGTDNMTGGLGADTFDFNSVAESPTLGAFDTITNFTWSEGDKIDLVTIDANLTLAGNQAFGLAQLSFNSVTSLFTADVIGGADLSINLVGVQAGFSVNLDVIA